MSIGIVFIGTPSKARCVLCKRVHAMLVEKGFQVKKLSDGYLEVSGIKDDSFPMFDNQTKED